MSIMHYFNIEPPKEEKRLTVILSNYEIHQPLCSSINVPASGKLIIEFDVAGDDVSAEKYQRILKAVKKAIASL